MRILLVICQLLCLLCCISVEAAETGAAVTTPHGWQAAPELAQEDRWTEPPLTAVPMETAYTLSEVELDIDKLILCQPTPQFPKVLQKTPEFSGNAYLLQLAFWLDRPPQHA